MRKIVIILNLIFAILFASLITFSQREPMPLNILVINAYHFNYQWTFNLNVGINKSINDAFPNAIIYTEFLDWKRFADEKLLSEQSLILADKYKETKIDLILTTDDKGLEFAIDYRKASFDNAPIVFSGIIEHTARNIIYDEKNITGVYEKMNPSGALDLIEVLKPDVKKIVLIHDMTESGLQTREAFTMDYDAHNLKQSTVLEDLSDLPFESLLDEVSRLDSDTVVMLISYNISSDGTIEKPETFGEKLSQASTAPVFSIDEFLLGHGIVGGTFLSGILQGETQAELGIQVLNGISPDVIEHVDEATVYSAIDENELLRFKLSKTHLSSDVQIVNPHFSFLETYKNIVITTLITFVFLVFFIVYLFINIQKRKKSEHEIQIQKMRLQKLNEQLSTSEEELRTQNESLEDYKEHLEYQAKHDTLTSLPNRVFLEEFLTERLFIKSKDFGEQLAVVFIDLDNFKFINNTYGHRFGDQVLLVVSKRLAELSTCNFTARIGGDEFILVVENSIIDIESINKLVILIKYALSLPIIIGDEEIKLSASIGFSIYPDDGLTCEDLILQSDISMFNAKKSGKSSHMHYEKAMGSTLENRYLLISHIKLAYDNKEFSLHYQPQINANTGQVVGFEALLRWNDKELGYIPPDKIIPLAESTGLIIPIGICIIEQSIKFALEMKLHLKTAFKVSINISVVQLLENSFENDLFDLLKKFKLEPDYIQLEITESVLIETSNIMIDKLNSMREKGISISLDDFGTGFSSLTYLLKLSINEIKIDKSFIDEMLTDSKPAKLVDTILYLAKELNLSVIAEGVETKEQQDYLLSRGCSVMQGFYNSKPLPMEEVVLFCEKHSN